MIKKAMETNVQHTPTNVAFLFPGQGSQVVGMGKDLYEKSPAAREIFQEVDEALSRPLTKVVFEGPQDDLIRTENAQPAISAVSLAAHAALSEQLGHAPAPTMLAGHSLGEYTTLAISGVLTLTETMRLIVERGRLMQRACNEQPGGMVALIGIDEFAAGDVCRETGTYLSNINSRDQIIISGDHINLARAIDLASARGAKKCVPLTVGGAFHSGLMEPAQSGLNKVIESMDFRDPSVPIFGNCHGTPLITANEVKEELSMQLMSCVRWQDSIKHMIADGADRFVEIGPGRILSGLLKRIDPSMHITGIRDMASVEKYAA